MRLKLEELWKDSDMDLAENAFEYTTNAIHDAHELIWNDEFEEDDSKAIFDYLYDQIHPVSFGDYLKRYIYKKAEIEEPFESVDARTYQDIILGSFADTNTPKSFHPTTTRLPVMIHAWLKQDSVHRDVVFLLGFGLSMSVEDVSYFLTHAIREQDFNFNNPAETVYWFCLKNHYSANHAMKLIALYDQLEPSDTGLFKDERTVSIRDAANKLPEDELIAFLRQLKTVHKDYPFSTTAKNEFLSLLDEVKTEIARLQNLGDSGKHYTVEGISDADVEQTIYCGIPLDDKGNLKKASLSRLKNAFADKRITRQRISQLKAGKMAISRSDLITLKFFLHACRNEDLLPSERFEAFIEETNEMLLRCYMGKLQITNAYEAFLLLCLLAELPLSAFSEVWEYSYED